jgi:inorganic triphosphatase YgiF
LPRTSPASRPAGTALPRIKPGGREIELKFLASAPVFKAVQDWEAFGRFARRPATQRLHSVYFDTEDGALRRNHAVLRVRAQRRGYVLAFKWDNPRLGNPFERGEVEVATSSAELNPDLLGADIARTIADLTEGRALLAVYSTDIRRGTRRVRVGESEIEVAFDHGFILAGEAREAVREIELELKSGEPETLYQLGLALSGSFEVQLGILTKSQRAALLRSGEAAQAVHPSAALGGEPLMDEAIGLSINACIGQFVANWPAFARGDAVDAIHQMRVALRRLRALLWLFQRAFPCAGFTAMRNQAKTLAATLGEARNWDVFIALTREGAAADFPQEPGFATLLAACDAHRAARYAAVGALLDAPETTRFVLEAQAFVARHGWRNAATSETLARLSEPARDFAARQLTRLHHRLLKQGRHIAHLPPHERHRLRIKLKKLRYVADMFGGLFEPQAQVRAYRRAAGKLQEQLGILNDLSTAHAMTAQLAQEDTETARTVGIVLGWCAGAVRADGKALAKSWKAFRRVRLFAHAA